jgi:hypothetical protein
LLLLLFYIKMNTFQGYSCASSNIDPPFTVEVKCLEAAVEPPVDEQEMRTWISVVYGGSAMDHALLIFERSELGQREPDHAKVVNTDAWKAKSEERRPEARGQAASVAIVKGGKVLEARQTEELAVNVVCRFAPTTTAAAASSRQERDIREDMVMMRHHRADEDLAQERLTQAQLGTEIGAL